MANPTIKDFFHKNTATGTGSGPDLTVTITSGANQKARVVLIARNTSGASVSDRCDLNSVAMTKVAEFAQVEVSLAVTITVYEMLNPPVGTFLMHPHYTTAGTGFDITFYVVQDTDQVLSSPTSVGTNTDATATPWALPTLSQTSTVDHALIQTAMGLPINQTVSVASGDTILSQGVQGTVVTGAVSYLDKTPAGAQVTAWQGSANWTRAIVVGWIDNPVPADFLTPAEKTSGSVFAVQGTVMSGLTTVTPGKADIPVTANYGSALSPTTADYEVSKLDGSGVILNWTAFVSPTFSQPNFSGVLKDVPEGGWIRWRVRFKNGGGTVIKTSGYTTIKFAAGYRIPRVGSSTNDHDFINGTGAADPYLICWIALPLGQGADAFQDLGTQGSGSLELARKFHEIKPGVMLLLVDCGKPGSDLKNEWELTSSSTYINYFSSIIDKIEAICGAGWHAVCATCGNNDQVAGTVTSTADFLARLITFAETNVRAKLGNYSGKATLPILYGGAQRNEQATNQPGGATDATIYYNRGIPAELQYARRTGVYGVFVKDLPLNPDGVHLSDAVGQVARSSRQGDTLAVALFGISRNYRGLYAVSKTYDPATGVMVVTWASRSSFGFGVGTSDGVLTGITGASVTDGGVAKTISSHTVTDAWKTTLQLPTALTDPKFSYLAGVNPDISHTLKLIE